MSHRGRFLYIAATLIAGVLVLIYRGPGWPFIRGHVGDWLVVQVMYLIGRFWIGDRWRYHWAGGVFLLGVLVEVIKLFTAELIPHTFFAEITIGSTFDPLDLIAFMLGLITVLVIEQVLSKRLFDRVDDFAE
jgi:hypothetical protein